LEAGGWIEGHNLRVFIMCSSTTKGSSPPVDEKLQFVFPACVPGTGSKKVSIKLFDKKHLVGDVAASGESVKNTLHAFIHALKTTAGLPVSAKQILETFSFEVEYFPDGPSSAERLSFGMMDFPVYLETTTAPNALSQTQAKDLLIAHRIPKETFVKRAIGVNEFSIRPTLPYDQAKEMFTADTTSDLGIGVPGTYFAREDDQRKCRKIGIIAVNLIKRNVADLTTRRFFAVLKHELGHMFGIAHHPGTLMDEKLSVAIRPENTAFTVDQVRILTQALAIIGAA
jgi:hypothetical protein